MLGVPTQTGNVPNGAIVLGDPWADVNHNEGVPLEWEDCEKGKCGNFYKLNKLKQSNPNLKTLLSVGGWTWSNHFSDVAADPAARSNFANSAVQVIRAYGFDGIDIDWEYPVEGGLPDNSTLPEDKHNFTLLLQETREKLTAAGAQDGRSYLLTIAGHANPSYASTTELDAIAEILDWINIMTYDFHGDWEQTTNHNASLYSDPNDPDTANKFSADMAINAYLNAGVLRLPKSSWVFRCTGGDGKIARPVPVATDSTKLARRIITAASFPMGPGTITSPDRRGCSITATWQPRT